MKMTSRRVGRWRLLDANAHQPLLDDYGRHLERVGLAPVSVTIHCGSVRHFLTWIVRTGIGVETVGAETVTQFAQHDCDCHSAPRPLGQSYINRVHRFLRHLAAAGVIAALPEPERPTVDRHVAAWLESLSCQKGLSPVTIANYGRMLAQILPLIGTDPSRYTAQITRDGLHEHARIAPSRHYPRMVASALRGYLRYLAVLGASPPDLDRAVPTARHWRLASLPRYLEPDAVERLIAGCDPATAAGRRDRAILLLLARLGLRARDVAELRLADIDWAGATLRFCGKGRREVRLPLPQDAGDALIAWLAGPQPPNRSDAVFLRLLPPFAPATSGLVSGVVNRALARAGIDNAPSRGTNLLRHSAATAMLRGGATLDAIGTVLRHRSPETTAHYAKVDVAMLGAVAQAWPAEDRRDGEVRATPILVQPWPEAATC
jgi:integrase/recombinase XerD